MIAILALGAMFSAAAFAKKSETMKSQWYINGKALAVGTVKSIECKLGEHEGLRTSLTTTVGKVNLKLTATGVSCPGGQLEEFEPAAGTKHAGGSATSIKFTGVTVDEPENCSTNAVLETEPLNAYVEMEEGSTEKAFIKFQPKNAGELFIKIPITGATCSIANPEYEIKGTVYGEAVNKTGVASTEQPVTFSKEIQETASGVTGGTLTFGGKPAFLTGRAIFFNVNGANESFSAKES
ncbi:MAG TPA: hypothetical protein VMF55_09060 [Solirubrobacterales bacterium]|nr:hypothetical protein [Solirubrobacterales bacterium]